jgi:hypothetical protein
LKKGTVLNRIITKMDKGNGEIPMPMCKELENFEDSRDGVLIKQLTIFLLSHPMRPSPLAENVMII